MPPDVARHRRHAQRPLGRAASPSRGDVAPAWRLAGYNLGPTDASSDWNAGPDTAHDSDADAETRDPD